MRFSRAGAWAGFLLGAHLFFLPCQHVAPRFNIPGAGACVVFGRDNRRLGARLQALVEILPVLAVVANAFSLPECECAFFF